MPHFVITGPDQASKIWNFPDADVFAIGRARACALVLPDPHHKVSQIHAAVVRVSKSEESYFIRDLGSRDPIRVGDEIVYQRLLQANDHIDVADYSLVFRTGDDASPPLPRLVRVRPEDYDDEAGAEAFDPTDLRSGSETDGTGHEIIEQFAELNDRSGSLRELVRRVCNYLNADRGFIARFSSRDARDYIELASFGLDRKEQVKFTSERLFDRLWNSEAVHDHKMVFVPIKSAEGVHGFFCFKRGPAVLQPFSSDHISFLVRLGELTATCCSSAPSCEGAAPANKIRAWPKCLVGTSGVMKILRKEIEIAAKAKKNVLVLGETGTGKQLIAEALHSRVFGPAAPWVERECLAIPESLAPTLLFGNEKVATGVPEAKGLFEMADGGTLFLDDIQYLPEAVRAQLYKVLENKRVVRIGSSRPKPVDVFVVAAMEIQPGTEDAGFARAFMERFEIKIKVPSLRQRREDIPLLAFSFLDSCTMKENKKTRSISHRALELLVKHDWPGNVRQLRNYIEDAVRQDVEVILSSDLPPLITSKSTDETTGDPDPFVPRTLAEIIKEAILKTLTATGGNIAKSARILDISNQGLRDKMKAYDIRRHQA